MVQNFLIDVPLLGCLGLMVGAALVDLLTYRIPNWLVGAVLGLYPFHVVANPETFDGRALVLAGLMLAFGFALFAWGKLGGGDGKLLAAASLWVGVDDAPAFLVVTALAGGGMALLAMGPRRLLLARAAAVVGGTRLHDGLLAGQLPYGIAIAVGSLFVLLPRLGA